MLLSMWWNQTDVNFLMESRIDNTLKRKLDKEKQKQTGQKYAQILHIIWDYKPIELSEKL